MKYNRTSLRATALDVKKAVEQSLHDQYDRAVKRHADELKKWEQAGKPQTIGVLTEALNKVRKGQQFNEWDLRNSISSPPGKPAPIECCNRQTKSLDGLVELLDTLADEEITANQLSAAGFKDLASILRRPC